MSFSPQTEVSNDPDALPSIATAVEQLGYDSLLFYDHVVGAEHANREPPLWGPYTQDDPFHDPFVAMGFAAAITKRIELATGVLILPQRQTVLVAQQAADVDLLSTIDYASVLGADGTGSNTTHWARTLRSGVGGSPSR